MVRRAVDENVPDGLGEFQNFLTVDQNLMASAEPHHVGAIFQYNGLEARGALHPTVGVFDGHVVHGGRVPTILDERVRARPMEVVVVAVEGVVMTVAADLAHTFSRNNMVRIR